MESFLCSNNIHITKVYTVYCVRWDRQYCQIPTDCRTTPRFGNIFGFYVTGVPSQMTHEYEKNSGSLTAQKILSTVSIAERRI